ncbi:MAG: DNA-3-methyladenine glycosylase [Bacteroidales bacterium]|nr:DNA-3-methyladenine glycosylase [Bacteroidales bacterium]
MKLRQSYYLEADVTKIARDLIGKALFTNFEGAVCGGIIIETEAYAGIRDKASHAYAGKRTLRTRVMYQSGGVAYVYLCYGIHSLFNIVTGPVEVPDAVLIRGILATHGLESIRQRLADTPFNNGFICGPGRVSKALRINKNHTGTDLAGELIWLEDTGLSIDHHKIMCTPRIGIAYAEEDAQLPYRFIISPQKAEDLMAN